MKRGNLLWTGSRMMLSEHRQLLNENLKKKINVDNDLERKQDEQLLNEWQDLWEQALTNNCKVLIDYGNQKRVIGKIADWKGEQKIIHIQTEEGCLIKVPVNKITDFKIE